MGLSFVSDFGERGCLFDSIPAAETWQMDPRLDMSKGIGTTLGKGEADGQGSLTHVAGCSQLSAVSFASENSAPNIVYQRRRLLKSPPTLTCTSVSTNTSSDMINFVYGRRKHHRGGVTNLSAIISANTWSIAACTSGVRSENPSAAALEKTRGSLETKATGVSTTSAIVGSKEAPLTTSETIDGCFVEDHGSDAKDKMNKTVELHSADDSCSSSMLNMDIGSRPLKTEIDDNDECSSSGAHVTDVMGDELSLSATHLCISVLRSHGLLSGLGPNRSDASEGDAPSCSGGDCSCSCNVCGSPGTAKDMLICDECEDAFHISCFYPSIRKMPIDDWYCQSCCKKKHKKIKETAFRKSSIIRSEKVSATLEGDLSPIDLMLNDSEPYISEVRVGKGFQAIVPEWSGAITEDIGVVPEPMELDPSVDLHDIASNKHCRSSFIGNWLQCREVIVGLGDGIDGAVCGKWRRAPLFEVQTDNWDCFRSVLWDPTHADCAAPQELETEEVLKQLKYIEMLRPRLAAKRRKFETWNANGSPASTEDGSKCTDSINLATFS